MLKFIQTFFMVTGSFAVVLSSGCSFPDSSQSDDDRPEFLVSTSVTVGGSITPTEISIKEGSSTGFTIDPDNGYVIDSVTGCGVFRYISSAHPNPYSTGSIQAACTVNVSFVQADPVVSIANTSVVEGNAGVSNLIFTVSLLASATTDVTVDFTTSNGSATAGSDFTTRSGTLTIAANEISTTLSIDVIGDTVFESNESVVITLSNVSANAELGTVIASGVILNDDRRTLNDTGITFGANYPSGNNSSCDGETISQQDCSVGFDFQQNDDSDGHAGFSYTKLDNDGLSLSASATAWSCVRDNNTGLIWEVKQGGNRIASDEGLHDADDIYSWYNTDAASNGGDSGVSSLVTFCHGYESSNRPTYCNTEAYVGRVNTATLCGAANWRVPTRLELLELVNLNQVTPAIDTTYFPGTRSTAYWSSTPHRAFPSSFFTVKYIDFLTGRSDSEVIKYGSTAQQDLTPHPVRLVRQ